MASAIAKVVFRWTVFFEFEQGVVMETGNLFRSWILAPAGLVFVAASAHAQPCETIRFEGGRYAGTVSGIAPPDDVVCYEMTARAGQTANLELKGRNVMFSILGIVDARDRYRFVTDNRTYRIHVGQLMRSVSDEPFSFSVSIR